MTGWMPEKTICVTTTRLPIFCALRESGCKMQAAAMEGVNPASADAAMNFRRLMQADERFIAK